MPNESKIRSAALFLNDIVILYLSLAAVLLARYPAVLFYQQWLEHWKPFSLVFIFWLLIFHINNLYDPQKIKISENFSRIFSAAVLAGSALSAIFFYLIPYFGITPKTNLVIFILIFGAADYLSRKFLNKVFISKGFQTNLLIVGGNKTAAELAENLTANPQLGYRLAFWMKEGFQNKNMEQIKRIIQDRKIDIAAIPNHIKKEPKNAEIVYQLIAAGTAARELYSVYEAVFQKIPLEELKESWFLENIFQNRRLFNALKRTGDLILSLSAAVIVLPALLILAPILIIASGWPIFYKQKRIGKNGKEFLIYKLRTMKTDAEAEGPKWSSGEKDERVTLIGKFLRRAHLDETPQLYNIIKGDLSLAGPRPERPEFVKLLKEKIPYYEIRHLIKPGVTGWAQINYRYGASVEDAYEKLQYDLYYLKNRSLWLDLSIILKTAKLLFSNPK